MSDANTPVEIKVLFVDDEKNILSSLRRLTMDEDFETLVAGSGAEGLEILAREENIGLVVSDQRMPEMTGAEFLARARELHPDIPRIVLTGYADVSAAIDAINKGGACRYIRKPWEDQELLQIIRSEVDRFRLQQENKRLQEIIRAKNEELEDWNRRLKARVLEQTGEIRKKNEKLYAHNTRLKKTLRGIIEALSNLIELRDKSLNSHAENVAALAREMATGMNLPEAERDCIYEAALLHDIGKIGIPDELLHGRIEDMSAPDVERYMQHAILGQTAIDGIIDLRPAGVLIRHHHEWYDGSGYPEGRKGEDIPLGARIIAMADYADRLLGPSPSQAAVKKAIGSIKELCRSRFDPDLLPHLEKPLLELYGQVVYADGKVGMILDPKDLRPGMLLAEDLYSGTGLMLLKKGTNLQEPQIESIHRYHLLDPFPGGVTVLVAEEQKAEDA